MSTSAQLAAVAAMTRDERIERRLAALEDRMEQVERLKARLPLGHDTVPEWLVQEEPTGG